MSISKKILIILVFLTVPNLSNANKDFIGVIGAAVGEIKIKIMKFYKTVLKYSLVTQ